MPAKKSKPAAKKPAAKPAKKASSKPAGKKPKSKPAPAKKPASKKPAPKPVKKAPAKPAPKKAPAKKPVSKPAAKKAAPAKKPAAPAKKAPAAKVAVKPVAKAAPAKKAAPAPAPAKASKAATKPAAAPSLPKGRTAPTARVNRVRPEDEGATIDIAKGPVKMTPFLKKQKQRLVDLRDAYLNSIEGVASETIRGNGADASAFGMHQADAGSDAYDRDFALSLLGKEQDALYEINEALKRIETGTYGLCEGTGNKIPEERLEAMPFARFTVVWQEKIEREQRRGGWNRPVHSLFGLDDPGDASDDDKDEEETPASSSNNNNSGESLDFSKE
ncbi:MAG: TraR/DksA C4-type zinc finger protein [Verrucomicrobiaceae bacterium]|nr:TraR/DksA C4-type zinc finger protein [Verrucomicrobiaceae bacterium]